MEAEEDAHAKGTIRWRVAWFHLTANVAYANKEKVEHVKVSLGYEEHTFNVPLWFQMAIQSSL